MRGCPKPSAILLISAHWEESKPTITSGANPGLIFDYYGFPAETYELAYPCGGEPELAKQVYQSLTEAGLSPELADRGFDHGMFVPLMLMYPQADIPVVQLSLVNSLDAQTHLDIGHALRALDYENLLVIGSGFSFHNQRAFRLPDLAVVESDNLSFVNWLKETCASSGIQDPERVKRLTDWESAPNARFCHPREEHLLPLHVCCGLAGRASDEYLPANILRVTSAGFYWSRPSS